MVRCCFQVEGPVLTQTCPIMWHGHLLVSFARWCNSSLGEPSGPLSMCKVVVFCPVRELPTQSGLISVSPCRPPTPAERSPAGTSRPSKPRSTSPWSSPRTEWRCPTWCVSHGHVAVSRRFILKVRVRVTQCFSFPFSRSLQSQGQPVFYIPLLIWSELGLDDFMQKKSRLFSLERFSLDYIYFFPDWKIWFEIGIEAWCIKSLNALGSVIRSCQTDSAWSL